MDKIYDKIRKLLALTGSSNMNEAANAARLVEELYQKYGISPDDIAPEDDEIQEEIVLEGKRISEGLKRLLYAVAWYYHCSAVEASGVHMRLIGRKANRIQARLYFEWLQGVMNKASEAAKREHLARGGRANGFYYSFAKAFASTIEDRLEELYRQRHAQEEAITLDSSALAVVEQRKKDRIDVANYVNSKYKTSSVVVTFTNPDAVAAGRNAAHSVGLGQQMTPAAKRLSGR